MILLSGSDEPLPFRDNVFIGKKMIRSGPAFATGGWLILLSSTGWSFLHEVKNIIAVNGIINKRIKIFFITKRLDLKNHDLTLTARTIIVWSKGGDPIGAGVGICLY